MKITDYRDPKGRFAKKRRNRWILTLMILGLIVYLGVKSNWSSIEPVELQKAQESELTQEQELYLKKQYELSVKETALKNKKAKLDAEYKSQSDSLEAELESIRAQKVSFQ